MDIVVSVFFSYKLFHLGKFSCYIMRTLKQHYEEVHVVKNLPGMGVSHLGSGSSSLGHILQYGPGQHLYYNLLRIPETGLHS